MIRINTTKDDQTVKQIKTILYAASLCKNKPAYGSWHVHLPQMLSVDSYAAHLVSSQRYHNLLCMHSIFAHVDGGYLWLPGIDVSINYTTSKIQKDISTWLITLIQITKPRRLEVVQYSRILWHEKQL